jgi:hypothetical protein
MTSLGYGGMNQPFFNCSKKRDFIDYSIRMALITPSCPGLLMMRARPASVRMTAPFVRRFRRT